MAQLSEVWSVTSGPWLRPPSTGTDSSVLGCGGGMVGSPIETCRASRWVQMGRNAHGFGHRNMKISCFLWCFYIINCLCPSQHWTPKFPLRKEPRKWMILVDDAPGVGRPRNVPGRGCSCRMRSWMMISVWRTWPLELQEVSADSWSSSCCRFPGRGSTIPICFQTMKSCGKQLSTPHLKKWNEFWGYLAHGFRRVCFSTTGAWNAQKNLAYFFCWILVSRKTGSRFILMLVKRCCSTKTEGALSERASTKPEKTKTAVTDRWISFELPLMLLPRSATLRCWERAELWRVVKRNTIIFFTLSIGLADIVSSNKIPTWPTEVGCGLSFGLPHDIFFRSISPATFCEAKIGVLANEKRECKI